MKLSASNRRRFWRSPAFWRVCLGTLGMAVAAHVWWNPGLDIRDGRDDRARNALWLGHGWLGADAWFGSDAAKKARFRSAPAIRQLAGHCRANGIRDLYPHLAPTQSDGAFIGTDDVQVERFLDGTAGLRVLPWIGGRLGAHITPSDPARCARFARSVGELLHKHPRLAGVHLNVEPWKSGDVAMLRLLQQLRAALPQGKMLSVAANPPATGLEPFKLTWSQSYTRQVAARCDQMTFMLYDSSIHDAKLYRWFYARWTRTILEWSHRPGAPEVLFGVPTYGAAGPKWGPLYHNPRVENLSNALSGLHRGLANYRAGHKKLPPQYAGAAIYCAWETDAPAWATWRREWRRK